MRRSRAPPYRRRMPGIGRRTYLVECYVPGARSEAVQAAVARACAAAAELRGEGRDVEHVSAIHVPGDEVAFHVFEAEDEDAVREASARSAVPYERIVESITLGGRAAGATRADR